MRSGERGMLDVVRRVFSRIERIVSWAGCIRIVRLLALVLIIVEAEYVVKGEFFSYYKTPLHLRAYRPSTSDRSRQPSVRTIISGLHIPISNPV